jgi:hypothetical protein
MTVRTTDHLLNKSIISIYILAIAALMYVTGESQVRNLHLI